MLGNFEKSSNMAKKIGIFFFYDFDYLPETRAKFWVYPTNHYFKHIYLLSHLLRSLGRPKPGLHLHSIPPRALI